MTLSILSDDAGFVVSTELILVSTILIVGILVGQVTLRDQILTEIADSADAVSAFDQTYMFGNITITNNDDPMNPFLEARVAGTAFTDSADFCDGNNNGAQGVNNFITGTCLRIDGNDNDPGAQEPVMPSTSN